MVAERVSLRLKRAAPIRVPLTLHPYEGLALPPKMTGVQCWMEAEQSWMVGRMSGDRREVR